MSNNEMNNLHETIKELKDYKLLKEEAEARIAELEAIVKDAIRATEDGKKLTCGEYKCSLATVNSERIDTKALKENAPDTFKLYAKVTTYERLTVR